MSKKKTIVDNLIFILLLVEIVVTIILISTFPYISDKIIKICVLIWGAAAAIIKLARREADVSSKDILQFLKLGVYIYPVVIFFFAIYYWSSSTTLHIDLYNPLLSNIRNEKITVLVGDKKYQMSLDSIDIPGLKPGHHTITFSGNKFIDRASINIMVDLFPDNLLSQTVPVKVLLGKLGFKDIPKSTTLRLHRLNSSDTTIIKLNDNEHVINGLLYGKYNCAFENDWYNISNLSNISLDKANADMISLRTPKKQFVVNLDFGKNRGKGSIKIYVDHQLKRDQSNSIKFSDYDEHLIEVKDFNRYLYFKTYARFNRKSALKKRIEVKLKEHFVTYVQFLSQRNSGCDLFIDGEPAGMIDNEYGVLRKIFEGIRKVELKKGKDTVYNKINYFPKIGTTFYVE